MAYYGAEMLASKPKSKIISLSCQVSNDKALLSSREKPRKLETENLSKKPKHIYVISYQDPKLVVAPESYDSFV